MEKQQRYLNILDFYTKANALKTTLFDEKNDESYADFIFGSMLLATLINSEFHETFNMAKIYRMILLKGLDSVEPDYSFDGFQMQKQFLEERNEVKDNHFYEAKLANLYMKANYIMRVFIDSNRNMPYEKLVKKGSRKLSSLIRQDPAKCEEIFKCYYLNDHLMHSIRSGWDKNHWNISSDRVERISEHVTSSLLLTMALQSEFPHSISYERVFKMLVNHELGENIIGDITPFDNVSPERKKELEHIAMGDALFNLSSKNFLLYLLYEFDEHETKEARYAHYCDKMDADLQSKLYQDQGYHRPMDEQSNNWVFHNPKAQKMVMDGAKDAFDIWYLWDKDCYNNDDEYPEFTELLETAKNLDLTNINQKQKTYIKED